MRSLHASIEAEGILIPVLVGFSAADVLKMRRMAKPIPTPVTVRALIDTGAEVSCVDPASLAPLLAAGLEHKRFVFANAPALGGALPAAEYYVSLSILHPSDDARANLVFGNHSVVEQPLGNLGYQVLLGRDVLAKCLQVHDGPG